MRISCNEIDLFGSSLLPHRLRTGQSGSVGRPGPGRSVRNMVKPHRAKYAPVQNRARSLRSRSLELRSAHDPHKRAHAPADCGRVGGGERIIHRAHSSAVRCVYACQRICTYATHTHRHKRDLITYDRRRHIHTYVRMLSVAYADIIPN